MFYVQFYVYRDTDRAIQKSQKKAAAAAVERRKKTKVFTRLY